mgnify:CR=1 FL=1
MVPCPEEFAFELSKEVMRLGLAKLMSAWTLETVTDLMSGLAPDEHALMVAVADATLDERTLTPVDVAEAIEIPVDRVGEVMRRVNLRCTDGGRVEILLLDDYSAQLENNPDQPPVLAMGRPIAQLVHHVTGAR